MPWARSLAAMLRVCAATGCRLTRPSAWAASCTARQLLHGVGEMVAVQAGGRQHHDPPARPSAARGTNFTRHAPAFVPHRLHAQQPQRLCFEQAWWRMVSTDHSDTASGGRLACQALVLSDQLLGSVAAGRPGLGRGYARRIKTAGCGPWGRRRGS